MTKKDSSRFDRFCDSVIKLIKIYIVGIFIFLAFRIFLIYSFGDFNELDLYKADLMKAFWIGFRFDTMVLCYTMIPALILMLIGFFIPLKYYYERFINSFLRWYFVSSYFVLVLLLTADYYFFKFFQSHFNLLVFGIFDDDTKAVMQSVWTDYPIIRVSLMLLALVFSLQWLFKRFTTAKISCYFKLLWSRIVVFALFLFLFFLGMRSSMGTFPLLKDDATISPNNFINSIVPNGVFALTDAISDRKHFSIDPDMDKTLKSYNFKTNRQVIETYLGKQLAGNGNLVDSLYRYTPENAFLEENPPNVIFIMMESMSNYYLDLHSDSLNLLGSLEKALEHCYLYRNFLSGHNGTVYSLEGLLLNSPLAPLSQSKYFDQSFSTSCALPFFEKGYHTAFITGAKLGWRNLGLFVGKQYFQQVEGNSIILDKVKGAIECEWGVFDEFMFDRIFDCLSESSNHKKPVFIFGFSTTNHTPFEHPGSYQPYSVKIPENISSVLRTSIDIARKNFTNYQYANDCLGKFIERVRNSPLGKNTIIAASGDHNTLQLFDYSDGQLLQKRSVPLVLYVPEQYLKNKSTDTHVFASHKDIFPTLFNLALSDAKYAGLGIDLFDKSINRTEFFSVNAYNTAFNDFGAVILGNIPLYYKWATPLRNALVPTNVSETPELKILVAKTNAYSAAATLLIQNEISENEKKLKRKVE